MTETTQTTEVSEQQTEVKVETQPQQDTKTFTQEDVDRIVTKRLEKVNKQWEAKFDSLQEAQKLAQLTEEQKQEYAYNKKLEDLNAREKAIAEREQAYNQQQYKATIEAELSKAGLPTAMSDLLVGLDAEAVANQINIMKESFATQVNAQIQAKVQASATNPTMPNEQSKPLTMEDIAKMSPQEIIKRKAEVDRTISEYYKTK